MASADAACTADAPDGVKAMAIIVDEAGCGGQPCRRASLTSRLVNGTKEVGNGDGQIGWPLKPLHLYTRTDNSSVSQAPQASAFACGALELSPDCL